MKHVFWICIAIAFTDIEPGRLIFCISDLIINNQACYQESRVVPVGSVESPVLRSVVEYIHGFLKAPKTNFFIGALPLRDHETDSLVNIEFL